MKKTLLVGALSVSIVLSGCATGEQFRANSYTQNQVNQRQAADTVDVLSVMPARVQVDNREAKKGAQIAATIGLAIIGGLLGAHSGNAGAGALAGGLGGAIGGGAISNTTMVDGVSIAYRTSAGQVFNSAQVGKLCEFKPGMAIVISAASNETRVQPNSTCPAT